MYGSRVIVMDFPSLPRLWIESTTWAWKYHETRPDALEKSAYPSKVLGLYIPQDHRERIMAGISTGISQTYNRPEFR